MSEKAENKPSGEKDPEKKTSQVTTKQLPDSKDNKQADKAEPAAPFLRRLTLFVVPVLLLVVVAIACLLLNKRLVYLEDGLTEVGNTNESVTEDLESRISNNSLRFPAINKELEELKTQQGVLSDALSEPAQQQFYINKDYALAEIEYLLIIANHNLQLTHNVPATLATMQAADARLKGLDGPKVQAVREQLIADMDNIKSINQADLSGLGLYLSDLINRVDDLPLKEEAITEPVEKQMPKQTKIKEANGFKQFFTRVWQELKSLVVITRNKNISKARLLPNEVYFLRTKIKLELANARFAVFNRDMENLHATIEHIQKYLNDYFDTTATAVANINVSMKRMKKIDLNFPKVDISSSLESVRGLMRTEDNQAGAGQTQ